MKNKLFLIALISVVNFYPLFGQKLLDNETVRITAYKSIEINSPFTISKNYFGDPLEAGNYKLPINELKNEFTKTFLLQEGDIFLKMRS
ncbi:MAG: hypothetical protein ACK5NB_04565 [Flavobacteriaceae bacterium]